MSSRSPESSALARSLHDVEPVLRGLARSDRAPIESILRATGVFNDAEVAVALELVDAPSEVGYRFLVAECDGRVAGYACFGATPMTDGVFDLYWIAVDPTLHGQGIGRRLMDATRAAVRATSGRMIVIETASKPSYDATRAFYLAYGCREVARIPDFYARGDDKVTYVVALDRAER
ncbi:MAG: GNAT family N-acetyltransferase [Planctomycetota bacterium]